MKKTETAPETALAVPACFNAPVGRVKPPGPRAVKRRALYPLLLSGVPKAFDGGKYTGLAAVCAKCNVRGTTGNMMDALRIAHRDYGYGFKYDPATDTLTMLDK